ncbi:MAG: hypothetical protein JW888_10355, partial [Pirellulales bacterium]|nr:hypothetical protein [Pirellulales bacterium]
MSLRDFAGNGNRPAAAVVAVACIVVGAANGAALPDERPSAEVLRGSPDWTPPTAEHVRAQAMSWLKEQKADKATRERAERLWKSLGEAPTATDRLAALAMTFAMVDPRADRLVRTCAAPRRGIELPDVAWLGGPDVGPLVSANLRLLLGRWLVHESLFDEACERLADLKPEDVVDPASLLFCQAVVHHRLLQKDQG